MADDLSTISLEQIESAIKAVLTRGESYTLPGGMIVKAANIKVLMELRNLRLQELSIQQNGGGMMVPYAYGRVGGKDT
jgi:hypothetical protein